MKHILKFIEVAFPTVVTGVAFWWASKSYWKKSINKPTDSGARPSFSKYYTRTQGQERQTTKKNFYSILKIPRNASQADIKKAYRRLALKWHPDKNLYNQEKATICFQDLAEAYEVLINVNKRRAYDQHDRGGLHASAGPRSRYCQDSFPDLFSDPFDRNSTTSGISSVITDMYTAFVYFAEQIYRRQPTKTC